MRKNWWVGVIGVLSACAVAAYFVWSLWEELQMYEERKDYEDEELMM